MRIDANGNELRQVSVWLPVAVIRLMRADGINVSGFIRDQLEILYGNSFGEPQDRRSRLAQAARESLDRQRRAEEAREAEREEARSAVRQMRTERDATRARQEGIADALVQIIGDDTPRHYSRMLPENDLNGDRVDDWETLVRRVSRLCGAEIDSAEVAAGLLLTSFCFATMGTLFASYPTESPGDIMSMLNVVRLPLIFISGVFIPLDQIPAVGRFIPLLSPLTYGNDLIRAAFTPETHFSPVVDVAVLFAFILGFQFSANRLYSRFNE